ncbi:YciI family protein [Rubrivivax sp. RP6-9]|uniref:YciI family protein n=1 Tax=Rubrivivax sp. RP6-9 TaxID=3415750 RepID=UPI003CC55FAF
MQFMLLIIEPPEQRGTRSAAEGPEVYAQMQRFAAGLQQRGVLRAVESLQSHARATRVQVRGGSTQLLDGPFAEAKEMIGGFFLVDVASRDEAVAIAADCPAAAWCTVEVRGLGPCFDDGPA